MAGVRDLDEYLSLIVGLRCYGALAMTILFTFMCSQNAVNQQPSVDAVIALINGFVSFCTVLVVCAYSYEQGQRLSKVATICLRNGENKWQTDEWNDMYHRGERCERAYFTIAGVTVTRESVMQICAALVSTLLVFAELARGPTNAEAGSSAINVTEKI
ncbi:uncharacterized protein LOC129592513 isoform X2 [Paramacrobiotus metropolitanus]|uniref:uncharacterized protein LOC129592513 isoform X2 n=1 Tax=Paramacrobiotus metropolitanus TaxID=2943436 RepID=UPI0024456DC2|nr:uncharacterized protein LOC129592513 isoform X2 [Paramacrobiotus metropolitanus]